MEFWLLKVQWYLTTHQSHSWVCGFFFFYSWVFLYPLIQKHTCTAMVTVVVREIRKIWKQPKHLSTEEWMQMWCIYMQWNITQAQKEWIFAFAATWIDLEVTQFSSLPQSCLTLCDPMDCSTPGLPAHHQLPEFTQAHVHWVGDATQPSHPLSSLSPPAFNLSQHQGLFKWVSSLHQGAKVLEFQRQHQFFQWIFRTDFL